MGTRGVGRCKEGKLTCSRGSWGECTGQTVPGDEACNGADDDCDGEIDNDVTAAATSDPDACDGVDNDCDMKVDENGTIECYTAQAGCTEANGMFSCRGLCRQGVRRCENGVLSRMCEGEVGPATLELCDIQGTAMDENCDGQTNEGCACRMGETQACYGGRAGTAGIGNCVMGEQACLGAGFGECVGEVRPGVENCQNPNRDDDCDGIFDNIPLLGEPCPPPQAMVGCRGTFQCRENEAMLTCVAVARVEVCGGGDEDCDGTIDESGACASGQSCCGRDCANLNEDREHCGRCNNICDSDESCIEGQCVTNMAGSGGSGEGGGGGMGAAGMGVGGEGADPEAGAGGTE